MAKQDHEMIQPCEFSRNAKLQQKTRNSHCHKFRARSETLLALGHPGGGGPDLETFRSVLRYNRLLKVELIAECYKYKTEWGKISKKK